MANQRGQVTMSEPEVDTFLTQQRSSTIATIGPQGQVNLVAMWFDWHDGHVWLETKTKAQKTVNLGRDSRLSFLTETGHTYDTLRGVAIEGHGVVLDDPDLVWDVCVRIWERYTAPYDEEARPLVEYMARNRSVIRLDADRVRSWDHRKLGLPAIELGGTTAAHLEPVPPVV